MERKTWHRVPRGPGGRRPILLLTVLPGIIWGCGEGERSAHDPDLSLPEGVEVVRHGGSLRDLPTAFRISGEASLNLGGRRDALDEELDPAFPFHDAARLPDGGWVVVDFFDLKVFDARGQYRFTIGEAGQGPGEFSQLRSACVSNRNAIVAIEYGAPRVTVFDSGGGVRHSALLPDRAVPQGSCFPDGSVLVRTSAASAGASGAWRRSDATLARLDVETLEATEFGVFPLVPHAGILGGSSGRIATPSGDEVLVAIPYEPEIRRYASTGELRQVVRWDEDRIPFDDAALAALIEEGHLRFPARAPGSQAPSASDAVARFRNEPRPAWLPFIGEMKTDAAERLWVRDHAWSPSGGSVWTVFGPDGHPLGRVAVPEIPEARGAIRLGSIGVDDVVLVWRDAALGFVHLTVHSLGALP